MTSKVLVTGGCGFIGSHLVEQLCEDHHVVVIDNLSTGRIENIAHIPDASYTLHKIDLSTVNISTLCDLLEGVDTVYHLAALADIVPSIQSPQEYYQSNVTATLNILEASRKSNIRRLVYSASSSCYGIPDVYPTPETSPIDPRYPYALTKNLGEQLCIHWHKVYGLPVISLRFFNVYGARSRTSGTYGAVFGVFLAQKLAGKPYTIVGDGEQTRDFTYVTDVCAALITAAKSGQLGEIYNVGSGKTVSINSIVDLLGGSKTYIPKRPGEPDSTYADISKIVSQTGWSPKISIEEGIQLMLKDLDYWRNAPVWEPCSIAEATKEWFEFLQ